jgi:hypothetical protein
LRSRETEGQGEAKEKRYQVTFVEEEETFREKVTWYLFSSFSTS